MEMAQSYIARIHSLLPRLHVEKCAHSFTYTLSSGRCVCVCVCVRQLFVVARKGGKSIFMLFMAIGQSQNANQKHFEFNRNLNNLQTVYVNVRNTTTTRAAAALHSTFLLEILSILLYIDRVEITITRRNNRGRWKKTHTHTFSYCAHKNRIIPVN